MPPKRMTANPLKPARYRPGKPLAGQEQSDEEDEDDEAVEEDQEDQEEDETPAPRIQPSSKIPQQPSVISKSLKNVDLNTRFQKTESDESEDEEEDEEEIQENEEENVPRKQAPGDDYASDDSDDSDDSDSEEEEKPRKVLMRPTFIPKPKRNAAATTETDKSAEIEAEAERRKAEAQALVQEQIRRDAAEKAANKKTWADDAVYQDPPDDTDDLDPAAERASWKLRELLRIKREREAIETIEKEREEVERRRNMDESERYEEDMEYVKKQREEAKEKRGEMGFLQKYYHKGAFYQDDSEVLNRNYSTAKVEDDVMNRDTLPKALQVRSLDQLGKRGRTKWTHLSAEDTSNLGKDVDNPWFEKKSSKFQAIPGMKDERFMPDKERDKRSTARGEEVPDRRRPDAPSDAPRGPRDNRDDRRNHRDDRDDRNDRDRYRGGRDDHRFNNDRDHHRRGHDQDRSHKNRSRSRSPRRGQDHYRDRKRYTDNDRHGEEKRRRIDT